MKFFVAVETKKKYIYIYNVCISKAMDDDVANIDKTLWLKLWKTVTREVKQLSREDMTNRVTEIN